MAGAGAAANGGRNGYAVLDRSEEQDLELDARRRPPVPESERRRRERFVYACAVFASLNAILLGYDVGVMSGCIIYMQKDLHITEFQQEILVGCLSVVSLVGSLSGGRTSDVIGRKWTMGLGAIVFQLGAAIMTFAPSFTVLMIGRLLAGVGIGFGAMYLECTLLRSPLLVPVGLSRPFLRYASIWGSSSAMFPIMPFRAFLSISIGGLCSVSVSFHLSSLALHFS